jgi:hypothetical protein
VLVWLITFFKKIANVNIKKMLAGYQYSFYSYLSDKQ